MQNIDYRKLLKICMMHWIDAEGGCWDGDLYDNPDHLSESEKEILKEVRNEASEELKKHPYF